MPWDVIEEMWNDGKVAAIPATSGHQVMADSSQWRRAVRGF